jgi:hypothetical protein
MHCVWIQFISDSTLLRGSTLVFFEDLEQGLNLLESSSYSQIFKFNFPTSLWPHLGPPIPAHSFIFSHLSPMSFPEHSPHSIINSWGCGFKWLSILGTFNKEWDHRSGMKNMSSSNLGAQRKCPNTILLTDWLAESHTWNRPIWKQRRFWTSPTPMECSEKYN